MSEDDFSKLTIEHKWSHIKETMDYIVSMDTAYSMRRRVNPHHPKKQQIEETRTVRQDQYDRWAHVKNLYAAHRDQLANTCENSEFEKCKNILERIFTAELDDALRKTLGE